MTRSAEDPCAGFVTVAATGLMAVVLALASAVAVLGSVAVTRHRAAAAADLAALAAAAHALEGEGVACAAARTIAAAHHATLSSCRLDGSEALVRVTVTPGSAVARWGTARAIARAGPAPRV